MNSLTRFFNQSGSWIWSSASAAVRWSAKNGFLKTESLDAGRVISVGNLQVGGAGKTPLVALIANEAGARGKSVAILCRGYGGEWESKGGMIAPGDQDIEARETGDEAALLHELAPQAWIGVGADRAKSYAKLKSRIRQRFDVVILDDGFQHWKLKRDLEIVAVTSHTRSSKLHRDWDRALEYADLVVWTKGEQRPELMGKPGVKIRFKVPPPQDAAKKYWLVTGVGDAEQVRDLLALAGWQIAEHVKFPDHAQYDQMLAQSLVVKARSQDCGLALTGKDWVKWKTLGVPRSAVSVLEPEMIFEEGKEIWSQTLWGS